MKPSDGATPEERRIIAHYKGMKKRFDPKRESLGPHIFMPLARQWKRPVREIKRIVGYRQSPPTDILVAQHEAVKRSDRFVRAIRRALIRGEFDKARYMLPNVREEMRSYYGELIDRREAEAHQMGV